MTSKLISILLASIAGTVIVFLFGFIAFNVVPPPDWFQRPFPADNPAVEGLSELSSGMYIYPYLESDGDMEAITRKMQEGPIFTLYLNSGMDFNLSVSLVEEMLRAFLAAVVVSFLLSLAYTNLCCYSYRVFFVGLCGLFAATTSEPTYSIWYWRPCGATTWMFCATVLAWTLAGFAIARLVKPWTGPREEAASE